MSTLQFSFKLLSLVLLSFTVGCQSCDPDEVFPGPFDSNIIRRCMEAEDLPVETVNQRLIGTWAEAHISNSSLPDSLGPFIDTLIFQDNNQVLVSYQFGHEIQRAYELESLIILERLTYRIQFDADVPTLPVDDILYCDDRLFFNDNFIGSSSDDREYGFNRVE